MVGISATINKFLCTLCQISQVAWQQELLYTLQISQTDRISLGQSRNVRTKKNKKVSNKREKEQDGSLTRATKRKIEADMMSASSSTSRCIQITNESLCPHGLLKRRLNTSFQHLPEVPNAKKPRCQLHRWARDRSGTEVFSGVTTCSVCRVNLCVRCYNIFHKEPFLTCKKGVIARS